MIIKQRCYFRDKPTLIILYIYIYIYRERERELAVSKSKVHRLYKLTIKKIQDKLWSSTLKYGVKWNINTRYEQVWHWYDTNLFGDEMTWSHTHMVDTILVYEINL